MDMQNKKVRFKNTRGFELLGKLEFPLLKDPVAYAIFAHVFTGNKNLGAARYISRALTQNGIAVLRFDFTGLGESEGDFEDTNFSTNIDDIKSASSFLEANYEAPTILVGHSLGGAAAIFAAGELEGINAVATVGAPSEPEHVTHLFGCSLEEIEEKGSAEVEISGRKFRIKKQFIDDLRAKNMPEIIKNMRKALLIMHSPQDGIVGIENAAKIYSYAFHPKSFVTLDHADHLLTNKDDAFYAGTVISSWLKRYIPVDEEIDLTTQQQVVARLGDLGYTTEIKAGRHSLLADESEELGGNDFGPSPYELLNAALGACTAMTLQMYARRKKWDLKEVKVHLNFGRSYKEDCENCPEEERRLETFQKFIELKGDLNDSQKQILLEIAERCPVNRTLAKAGSFETKLYEPE